MRGRDSGGDEGESMSEDEGESRGGDEGESRGEDQGESREVRTRVNVRADLRGDFTKVCKVLHDCLGRRAMNATIIRGDEGMTGRRDDGDSRIKGYRVLSEGQ